MPKNLLLIAGLDPTANAGILRDLEIASSFRLKSSAIVTALTAQNKNKFFGLEIISSPLFKNQLKALSPLVQYGAIKIGMLGNEKIIQALTSFLKAQKKHPPMVLDPIYQSSTGGTLLTNKGKKYLVDKLLPLATIWTPNINEAQFFSGLKITNQAHMKKAAEKLWNKNNIPILIKGGHLKDKICDFYFDGNNENWFRHANKKKNEIRGTGCALSSIIAGYLCHGYPLHEAILQAEGTMQDWIKKL